MDAQYFKNLGSIERSFKFIRVVMFGVIIGFILFGMGISYWAFDTVDKSRQRAYVIEHGSSIMLTLAQEHNINRSAEAKDHVKSFLKLLFELEPDEEQIKKSFERATYMGDRASVYRIYTDLKEKGYFTNLIQGDVHLKVQIEMDEITVNMTQSPYSFRIKGRQVLIRETSMTTRNLEVEGYLVDVQRTDNNTHGFNVERFKVLDQRDIETITRNPDGDKL